MGGSWAYYDDMSELAMFLFIKREHTREFTEAWRKYETEVPQNTKEDRIQKRCSKRFAHPAGLCEANAGMLESKTGSRNLEEGWGVAISIRGTRGGGLERST